ncbi:unnamed protein product, partial [Ascophyllum nodosum]
MANEEVCPRDEIADPPDRRVSLHSRRRKRRGGNDSGPQPRWPRANRARKPQGVDRGIQGLWNSITHSSAHVHRQLSMLLDFIVGNCAPDRTVGGAYWIHRLQTAKPRYHRVHQ